MPPADPLTTVVSTKGQVVLPKRIRTTRAWGPGTRLQVEETADGVLLRRGAFFAPTEMADVFGSLKTDGRVRTLEEMDAAVAAEARRRHAGD